MNLKLPYTLLLFFLFSICGFSQSSKDIKGHWFTIDKEAIVEITGSNDNYNGKIVWLNPTKPNQKERIKLLEATVISHLVYLENNEYHEGDLFDVRGDRHFQLSAELNNDELNLIVHWAGLRRISFGCEYLKE